MSEPITPKEFIAEIHELEHPEGYPTCHAMNRYSELYNYSVARISELEAENAELEKSLLEASVRTDYTPDHWKRVASDD